MAILTLRTLPERCLREKAQPVAQVDDRIRGLLEDMLETMYACDGIGLAANQVGLLERLAVMDVSAQGEKPAPFKMVNPEIIWLSEEKQAVTQGCLSIPGYSAEVKRPRALKLRYLDEHGQQQQLEAEGWMAECIQHEIDHLNGILYIDHLSPLRRSLILRKLHKSKRHKE